MLPNLEYVKSILRAQVATVTFLKNNGERREMQCTLNMEHVPPSMWPKGTLTEQNATDQVRVFDIKAQGWRSFNFKNFITIEFSAANGEAMGFSTTEK